LLVFEQQDDRVVIIESLTMAVKNFPFSPGVRRN